MHFISCVLEITFFCQLQNIIMPNTNYKGFENIEKPHHLLRGHQLITGVKEKVV